MKFNRVFSMPSAWTFTIKPVRELLAKYDVGVGWVDPFAGDNSPAEITNDMNPERKATFHLEAKEFCETLHSAYSGVLYDPPYSFRQVSEHYKMLGKKASAIDTSANFHKKVKDVVAPKIKIGGHSISFGWNSMGMGKTRGFEIVEILLVAHGSNNNDTIVTVEKRIK